MDSVFLNHLLAKARARPMRIVFPESDAVSILEAAAALVELGAALPILIGVPEEVSETAESAGVSLDGIAVVDHNDEGLQAEIAREYVSCCDLLSEKGILRKLKKREPFAAAMVKVGRADCFASGYTCTTADTIFTAQTVLGMKEGISTVSSLCVLEAPGFGGPEGDLLCFTDCVVFPNPTSSELADIAISACDTMRHLMGWEPRAGLLSFSTKGGGEDPIVAKVVDAVAIANGRRPDLHIDGEFQLDAAIIPAVAAKKVKEKSEVAGRANIIVFPDLNAGNIGVKLVNIFAGYPVHGALLQGIAKPCVDFSRSAPLDQMIGALVMLAVTAQE